MSTNRGQFKKGEGGRPRGAKNKSTEVLKRLYAEIASGAGERLSTRLDKMSNRELIQLLQAVGKFVLPTLQSIDAEINGTQEHWHNMSKEQKMEIVKMYYGETED